MSDDDLFGWETRARTDDPWTSKAAAKRIMRSITDKHRKVQEVHRAHRKGLTDWELEEICRDHGATYRTRRQELSNPEWFNPPYIINSGKTKKNAESEHPETERIIWLWAEYADPYLRSPMPARPPEPEAPPPPTNAHLDKDGNLIHDKCATCGAPAAHGIGVALRKGHLGMWYCAKHVP